MNAALIELKIKEDDIVFDIGAGDGRFIIHCAENTPVSKCIGIEIDEERGNEALTKIQDLNLQSKCQMIIGNALEQDFSSGTAFFLYLIPRGLRIILPYLQSLGKPIRVVTYMAPFPDLAAKNVVNVSTENHPEARWPLYYYEI